MSKLRAIYSGLQYIPTFFTDTSLTSEDIFKITEFPLRLTAGKNFLTSQATPDTWQELWVLLIF